MGADVKTDGQGRIRDGWWRKELWHGETKETKTI